MNKVLVYTFTFVSLFNLSSFFRYCLADDRLLDAVKFLDLGDGAGWELLQVEHLDFFFPLITIHNTRVPMQILRFGLFMNSHKLIRVLNTGERSQEKRIQKQCYRFLLKLFR